jgi:hypothetical protein
MKPVSEVMLLLGRTFARSDSEVASAEKRGCARRRVAPAKPRPDATLIRPLARAHRWKRLIEHGTCRSAAEIAEAEGVTRSYVNQLLRLTLLAPDIQEAILEDGSRKRCSWRS